MENSVKENLLKVLEEIREAEKKAGRKENSVKLMAVSKFHPASDVIQAIQEGQFLFGENRVQEAYSKFEEIRSFPLVKSQPVHLHIIGSLQTNKVKKAVEISSCIQSVDRLSLIEEINKRSGEVGKKTDIFFELHTAEDSKSGFPCEKDILSALDLFEKGFYPNVNPRGFMTMAPFTDDEKAVRSSFKTLRLLKEKAQMLHPDFLLDQLSMGMSGDFKIAIEEGSTMVRIGTAIFGQRKAG